MQKTHPPRRHLGKVILSFGPPIVAVVFLMIGVAALPRTVAPIPERVLRHEADVVLPDGAIIAVQVADQTPEQERGLGGLKSMRDDQGLLFRFDTPSRYTFWMKDMMFPLDIIWIRDETIVDSKENAPVPAGPVPDEIYMPEADSETVLELTAGSVARHNLKNGDHLDIRMLAGYSLPTN